MILSVARRIMRRWVRWERNRIIVVRRRGRVISKMEKDMANGRVSFFGLQDQCYLVLAS